jgi:signal transduction histidine kinase/ligand-binding sensor domain-containing protein
MRGATRLGPFRRALVICLFGALQCTPTNALDPNRQVTQYAHTAWRVQDGVFSGLPSAITQTADGYLWIGTQAGLVRFDGVRFVPWTPPGTERLLSSSIFSLLGATDGSLWIGSGAGLGHLKDGDLINYQDAPGRINSIIEDRNGTVWIARSRVHDPAGPLCQVIDTHLQCYGKADGIPFPYAGPLVDDSLGNLWIGSTSMLARWKPDSSSIYVPAGLKSTEGLNGVAALAAAPDGSLWIGMARSGRGLGLQQLLQGTWKAFVKPGLDGTTLEVNSLLLDRESTLWIGTEAQGIYRIRRTKVDHFSSADGLSSDSVNSFYEDREGNLWVATSKGIDSFRNIPVISFSTREGLSADKVDSVLASRNGTVWIGNHRALDFLHQGDVSSIQAKNGLPGGRVTSLLEDHAGRLWVGVEDGLSVYEKGKFSPVKRADGTAIGVVVAMAEDVDDSIWAEVIGNPARLIRIQERKVREEFPAPQMPDALTIAADPQGGIWLGLVDGDLARYRHGQLQTFPIKNSLRSNAVRQVLVNSDGSVLGATPSGLIELRNGGVETLTTRNGLPCNEIYTIISDSQSALWLYTSCGLVTIGQEELHKWSDHPETTVKLRVFDVLDGAQPSSAPFRPTASRSPDGRLWFANENVLQMIDPGQLARNAIPPPVHIEEIIADRKNYTPADSLRLPSRTRDLEIDYTALSFVVPQKVRFRYKLEGRDADWQDPQTRHQAFYSNLRPGNYRFRVIACNNDGVWNEAGASLNFTLLPAFYQTNWFLLLCVAAFGGIGWAAYRWRIRQVAARLDSQFEERLAERTRIAQDLHDTLLQGFLSASMQLHVANDQLPEDWPAKPIVSRVLDLMGQVIDDGRNALRGLRSSTAESDDLERVLSQILQEFVLQQPIDFRVIVEGQARPLHPVIRDEVYRVGREALANAFRHSRASGIEVELEYGDSQLRVLVRDNGCGIDPDVLRSGRDGHWGLSGMRERADRIGARLRVRSRAAGGTEVELSVPGHVAFRVRSTGHGPSWLSRLRMGKAKPDVHEGGVER